MNLNDLHSILFNAHILYSLALGIWSAVMAIRNESISGNFWGAVATITILAGIITLIGVVMTAQGLRPERLVTYYLYMSWLVVIMPGLFTLLRGRDDRNAAIAFSILSIFNAATSLSMIQRHVVGPGAKYVLALVIGLLILCACEPEPTPLPSILPTDPPTENVDAAATPAPLRYALAPDALAYLTDSDRALIAASAEIVPLDAPPAANDLGTRYEIVVALGDLPGGTRAPSPLQISLLIDTTLSPLDDPALADILRRAIDPSLLANALNLAADQRTTATSVPPAALRTELANTGYPDGFDLTFASPFARDAQAIAQVLTVYGIETRLVADEPAHLTVTNIPPTDSLSAIEVPLYSLPISYHAVDGLTITFTPSGFPIASR